MTRIEIAIQILTCSALVGLLGAVGLRLTYAEVKTALHRCRFIAILLLNFVFVPAIAVATAVAFDLNRDLAIGMVLLAAAPFAPVVPVFARMARARLALAAALTGVFPIVSALLTPFAAQTALRFFAREDVSSFGIWRSLALLIATTTLPLTIGVVVRHELPKLGHRLLRPLEKISEVIGAASLAFVTVTQFASIVTLGWRSWLAMALISEASLALGWLLGGPDRGSRQVIALGTSNRNIALALLVAIQNFRRIEVASAVVGNGLLLIALGLLHVAWWRFGPGRHRAA
jgi:BASS family bile acid:Na+ symporter